MSKDLPKAPPRTAESKREELGADGAGAGVRTPDLARRDLLGRLGFGVATVALVAPVVMSARALVPNVLYEAPQRFKAGRPDQLTDGPNLIPEQRVYLFKQGNTFYCLSAACTHLGCTVQLVRTNRGDTTEERVEFHCPCHGSKFRGDGTNYAGPAPRPLDYYQISLAPDDGQLVVDLSRVADKGWRFTV